MDQNVRKRRSKWDMLTDPDVPSEMREDNAPLPLTSDNSRKNEESNLFWNPSKPEGLQVSHWVDMKVIPYNDSSEAVQSSKWLKSEGENIRPHSPKLREMEAIDLDGYKRLNWEPESGPTETEPGNLYESPKTPDVELGDEDGAKRLCWEVNTGPIEPDDGNILESPKTPYVELGDGDGFKNSSLEPTSITQIEAKDGSIGSGIDGLCEAVTAGNDGSLSREMNSWGGDLTTEKDARASRTTDGLGTALKSKDGNASKETDGWSTARDQNSRASMPHGLNPRRRDSRSISPRDGWSRSRRSPSRSRRRSRSRGRSQSRSPARGLKHRPERWADRDRTGGYRPPCRDFAAGRCGRGNQCRFLHNDGARRHFDRGASDKKESRYEKDYVRDRLPLRHGNQYERDREKLDLHRNSRPTSRCYNFTEGKCYRGSSCRYAHDTSSDNGWDKKDEARDRPRDKRDDNASVGRPQRVSNGPCKYFSEGRCIHGENCKFSHEGLLLGRSDERPGDVKRDYSKKTDSYSLTALMNDNNGDARAAAVQTHGTEDTRHKSQHPQSQGVGYPMLPQDAPQNALPSQVLSKTQGPQSQGIGYPMLPQDAPQKALPPQVLSKTQGPQSQGVGYPMLPQDAPQKALPSQVLSKTQGASGHKSQHPGSQEIKYQMLPHDAPQKALPAQMQNTIQGASGQQDIISASNLSTGQSLIQSGLSQLMATQPPQLPGFPPIVHIQHAVPTQAVSGQMQQMYPMPINGNRQFILHPFPPNLQIGQNQQNFNLTGRMQQNIHHPHNLLNHQNLGLAGLNPNLPQPQIAQIHPNFHLGGHIQQGIPISPNGQNPQNIISRHNPQSFLHPMQSGQSQQNHHPLGPNDQAQPPSNPQNPNSNSGTSVAQKVVTSEQAAQITNLSASLAQFFGNGPQLPNLYAALNPQNATEPTPLQPFLDPGAMIPVSSTVAPSIQTQNQSDSGSDSMDLDNSNAPPGFSTISIEQKDITSRETQTSLKSSVPVTATSETKDTNQVQQKDAKFGESQASLKSSVLLTATSDTKSTDQGNHEAKKVEMSGDDESKDANETETGQSKKDRTDRTEDINTGESKKSKDAKGLRMFKCALVEFVKDVLKPAWKEGHLSKEVHKTIVKKVVEKVTGAMQASSVPHTQDKIDVYLAHSKEKLNKLVQAYVEKYV